MWREIPAIGVASDVVAVEAADRVLQIPPQPWVVGWWREGVGVGARSGTAVLAAHLDSRQYGTGPFVRATSLRPGDAMTIGTDGGARHRYVVSEVETYRKESLPYERLFDQAGHARVVLVTCGGRFRAEAGGWDSNVVVFFVPDPG